MKKKMVAREPVQVYLDAPDRERLDRLAGRFDVSMSEVLRRGLEALEREAVDPARDPLARFILERQAEITEGRATRPGKARRVDPVAEALADEHAAQIGEWHRRRGRGRA